MFILYINLERLGEQEIRSFGGGIYRKSVIELKLVNILQWHNAKQRYIIFSLNFHLPF